MNRIYEQAWVVPVGLLLSVACGDADESTNRGVPSTGGADGGTESTGRGGTTVSGGAGGKGGADGRSYDRGFQDGSSGARDASGLDRDGGQPDGDGAVVDSGDEAFNDGSSGTGTGSSGTGGLAGEPSGGTSGSGGGGVGGGGQKPRLDAPTITPSGGSVVERQVTVEMTGAPSGAQIRYTTDGSEPIETSFPYSGPFSPPSQETVRINAKVFNSPDYLPSNTASVEYRFTPAAPIIKSAEADDKDRIAVTWQDNSSIEKYFEVDCSSKTKTVGSGIAGTTIDGLRAGTSYTCKIRAINNNGPSEWSASITVTTLHVYTLTLVPDTEETVPDPSLVILTGGGEYTENEIIDITATAYFNYSWNEGAPAMRSDFFWWWVDDPYKGQVEWVGGTDCEDHIAKIKISSNVVLEAIYN